MLACGIGLGLSTPRSRVGFGVLGFGVLGFWVQGLGFRV